MDIPKVAKGLSDPLSGEVLSWFRRAIPVTTPPKARTAGKTQGSLQRMAAAVPKSIRAMVNRVVTTARPNLHAATATKATAPGWTPSNQAGRDSPGNWATPSPASIMIATAGYRKQIKASGRPKARRGPCPRPPPFEWKLGREVLGPALEARQTVVRRATGASPQTAREAGRCGLEARRKQSIPRAKTTIPPAPNGARAARAGRLHRPRLLRHRLCYERTVETYLPVSFSAACRCWRRMILYQHTVVR